MEFLSNPFKVWASGDFPSQRAVLKLAFADRITYARGEGYRTAKKSLPFEVFGGLISRSKLPEDSGGKDFQGDERPAGFSSSGGTYTPPLVEFSKMVGRTGFEPVTNWLKARRSILSSCFY